MHIWKFILREVKVELAFKSYASYAYFLLWWYDVSYDDVCLMIYSNIHNIHCKCSPTFSLVRTLQIHVRNVICFEVIAALSRFTCNRTIEKGIFEILSSSQDKFKYKTDMFVSIVWYTSYLSCLKCGKGIDVKQSGKQHLVNELLATRTIRKWSCTLFNWSNVRKLAPFK